MAASGPVSHESGSEDGDTMRRGGGTAPAVVADAVLGLCVAVGLVAASAAGIGVGAVAGARPVNAGLVALAVAIGAAVAVRRRYPVAALVGLAALCLLWFAADYPGLLVGLAPLIGCYTLAAERGWRWGSAPPCPRRWSRSSVSGWCSATPGP